MRHGDATAHWKDWDRSLSEKGKNDVTFVCSEIFKYADFLPKFVICSEALRTKETFEIFSSLHPIPKDRCVFVDSLYYGKFFDVLKEISKVPSEIQSLMLIGHNPLITELAETLSKKSLRMGTSNALLLEADVNWVDITSTTWNYKQLLTPLERIHF